jgi:hypothetical protein
MLFCASSPKTIPLSNNKDDTPREALVAHTCNLSYLGGRDQKDLSLKPAPANSLETLSQKYPAQKGLVGYFKW